MSKSEKEIKMDMEALADMLTDLKKRVKAYNKLAVSAQADARVSLIIGNNGSEFNDCEYYNPEADFWFPSSC